MSNINKTIYDAIKPHVQNDKKINSNTEFIQVPILYYIDKDTGKKHYDIEEMANQFENELSKKTECVVMCTIEESCI